jgi:hypothetical protein
MWGFIEPLLLQSSDNNTLKEALLLARLRLVQGLSDKMHVKSLARYLEGVNGHTYPVLD